MRKRVRVAAALLAAFLVDEVLVPRLLLLADEVQVEQVRCEQRQERDVVPPVRCLINKALNRVSKRF